MPSFAPSLLSSWTGGQWTSKPTQPLHGFSQDSRKLSPGDVFVALKTEKRDGHDFLSEAGAAGAGAALVSRPAADLALPQLVVADPLAAFQAIAREHRRGFGRPVLGVTGSCGKTSTKNLLARLLGGGATVLATEGNLNNHIGVPLTLTRLEAERHEFAVVEAGISAPGEMATLASMIEPDYAVVTLVAPAHTQELGGMEGVAREKSVLLNRIRNGGLGVFPSQCWDFSPFRELAEHCIVAVPAGQTISAPRSVVFSVRSTATESEVWIGARRFTFRRVTRGMAQNAVLGILLASEMGISDDALQRALKDWQPAKWRGELRHELGRTLYLDFYNANPASMADALENFQTLVPPAEPRLYVLGCMEELGNESARYHRELGATLALRPQDRAYVIGSEADSVRAGALAAGPHGGQVDVMTDVGAIARKVAGFQGSVFIKGSRRYQLEKVLPPESAGPAPRVEAPLPC